VGNLLESPDLQDVGECPVDTGGFAKKIWRDSRGSGREPFDWSLFYLAFLALFFVSVAASTKFAQINFRGSNASEGVSVAPSTNFTQYLIAFRNSDAPEGGTDYNGIPASDPRDAVALVYEECAEQCGSKQEPFDWTTFSQQFSAWLLPWLALVSQIPFGAESHLDNLISGESPSSAHQFILLIFLPQSTSRPHCWVSHPRSVLTRHHSQQHSLGL
jgi:hypothetical protein